MKKILALITAFFMSLSTSTDYTVVSDKPYTNNTYTVTDTTMPDYRSYFLGGEGASSSSGCQTINYNSNAKMVKSSTGFWFIDGTEPEMTDTHTKFKAKLYTYKPDPDDNTKMLRDDGKPTLTAIKSSSGNYKDAGIKSGMFLDGQYIIAPFKCVLDSRSVSGSVNSMKLICNVGATSYSIRINNMKCWYCDVNRTGDLQFHTSDEQFGKTFSAGNVLGVATPETYIIIRPVDASGTVIGHCSMAQFYRGAFTKFEENN